MAATFTKTKAHGAGVGALIGTVLGGFADAWLADAVDAQTSTMIWGVANLLGAWLGAYLAPPNRLK